MANLYSYRVRVLFQGGKELNFTNLDYDFAKKKFLFFVSACLEFDNELSVRCINIFRNNTCIRYFQNYSLSDRKLVKP